MSQPPAGPAPYSSAPPPAGGPAPHQSSTRAIIALILAIIPTVVTNLIGLVLGLVVLVGRKNPKNGGRGLAIAAVIIAILELLVLAVGIVLAVVVAGAGPDRDSDGTITAAGTVSIDGLRTGDCVVKAFDAQTVLRTIDVGPCSTSHRGQVYATFTLKGGDDYPGEENVARQSERQCTARGRQALADPSDSSLQVVYLYPRVQDWARSHQVSCIVESQKALTSSLLK